MSEKVAKLDSIVGRLLSYISLCLRNICEKLHLLKKQLQQQQQKHFNFFFTSKEKNGTTWTL